MFTLPENSKMYYSYPGTMIITIYSNIGSLIATYRFTNSSLFEAAEKFIYNRLIQPNMLLTKRKSTMVIIQLSSRGKFLRYWSYLEILNSTFSYESIKKCNCGYIRYHRGFKWMIE